MLTSYRPRCRRARRAAIEAALHNPSKDGRHNSRPTERGGRISDRANSRKPRVTPRRAALSPRCAALFPWACRTPRRRRSVSSTGFGFGAPKTSSWLAGAGVGLAVVTSAGTRVCPPGSSDLRPVLGGAIDLEVEIDLRAEAQRHRVHRLKIGGVPVGALADRLQRVLGRADQAHDLRVLQLRVVAQEPQHGVRPVLPARQRRVARAARLLELRRADLRDRQVQAMARSRSAAAISSRVSWPVEIGS